MPASVRNSSLLTLVFTFTSNRSMEIYFKNTKDSKLLNCLKKLGTRKALRSTDLNASQKEMALKILFIKKKLNKILKKMTQKTIKTITTHPPILELTNLGKKTILFSINLIQKNSLKIKLNFNRIFQDLILTNLKIKCPIPIHI